MPHPGSVVLAARGEINENTIDILREPLTALIDDPPRALALDLDQVSFFDRAGINLLIDATKRAHRCRVRFSIVAGTQSVRLALGRYGLFDLLPVYRERKLAFA